jgi:hypothetical protein
MNIPIAITATGQILQIARALSDPFEPDITRRQRKNLT